MTTSTEPPGADPLTCPELVEMATDHLEGVLEPPGEALVVEHLSRCPHCPRYLDQLRLAAELVGKLRDEPRGAAGPPGDLLDAFRSATRTPRGRRSRGADRSSVPRTEAGRDPREDGRRRRP